jgi:hypothetical protein
MNARTPELQTSRGRFFFWLGLIILPIFWVWWMRPAYFSRTQRRVGWVWTACYVGALVFFREPLGHHLDGLSFSYPFVAIRLGCALWLWLLLRIYRVGQIIFGFMMSTQVLAMLADVGAHLMQRMPSPGFWIFPLIPAVLHLLVEPVRRWQRRSIVGQ